MEEMKEISGMANLPVILATDGTMVLESDLSLAELDQMQMIIKNSYGPKGRDGIALQAGREFFSDFFRRFGASLGFLDQKYRMLPTKKRITTGLNILAETLSKHFNVPFSVTDDCEKWNFGIERTPAEKMGGDLLDPAQYFLIGLLQEYLLWAAGGKVYPLFNSSAEGIPLEISISKKSLS